MDAQDSPYSMMLTGSSFVQKLHIMVSSESKDIICWSRDGSMFEVKDPKRLENEILVKYFRHTRFQSLVRQLNFYDFKKISKERSTWMYSHEYFIRGHPEYLDYLRRKTNNSPSVLPLKILAKVDHYDEVGDGNDCFDVKKRRIDSFSSTSTDDSDLESSLTPDSHNFSLFLHNWEHTAHTMCPSAYDILDGTSEDISTEFRESANSSPDNDEEAAQNGIQQRKLNLTLSRLIAREENEFGRVENLITFSFDRNPFHAPQNLLSEVHSLLATNPCLGQDLNSYFKALYPSGICSDIFRESEVLLMRTFMTFTVLKLQALTEILHSESLTFPSSKLHECAQKRLHLWSTFTRLFL